MELREHLIGPIAREDEAGQIEVDVGALIRRLVLFEKYTLRTIRLREIPILVHAFGEGGLRSLLADGCLRIHCEALTVGEISSLDPPGNLPPGALRFSTVRMADRREYVSGCLQQVHQVEDLSMRQIKQLKQAILATLVHEIEDPGDLAMNQMDTDLEKESPVLASGVSLALQREFGIDLKPTAISLNIERLDDRGGVFITSNVQDLTGLDKTGAEHALVRGLLAVGGMNIRTELMNRLEGISGCEPGELQLFEGRLGALLDEMNPDRQEERFLRVLELAELPEPELTASPAVDIDALLAARSSPEAQALRRWLRSVDRLSDAEITDSFNAVRDLLSRAVHSKSGKVTRIAINTALGFIPGGNLAGAALGGLDSFFLERLVPEPGPLSFVSHTWPSLFTGS